MSSGAAELLKQAMALPAIERASLAEELLASLDRADARIDELWAKEAAHRLEAFEAGRMKDIPAADVFAEFESS